MKAFIVKAFLNLYTPVFCFTNIFNEKKQLIVTLFFKKRGIKN